MRKDWRFKNLIGKASVFFAFLCMGMMLQGCGDKVQSETAESTESSSGFDVDAFNNVEKEPNIEAPSEAEDAGEESSEAAESDVEASEETEIRKESSADNDASNEVICARGGISNLGDLKNFIDSSFCIAH